MDMWHDMRHPLKHKRGACGTKEKISIFFFFFYVREIGEEESFQASLFDPQSSAGWNSSSQV